MATAPVVGVSEHVRCSPERAWEVFTEGIGGWWPLASHSVFEADAETAVIEPRVGGRIYERAGEREHDWGRVLVYEPPARIVLEWQLSPDNPPTEVEVTFTVEGDGTRVDLEHRGWERFGDRSGELHAGYGGEGGWPLVLGRFADAANATS